MSQEALLERIRNARVVYEPPGAEAAVVRRDAEFVGADGRVCLMDLYSPPDSASGTLRPAVIIVAGYPDPGVEKRLSSRAKDIGSSQSWGRLLAASGMVAIAYANREPVADLQALLHHITRQAGSLGLDASRLGLWASSGNGPVALSRLAPGPQPPVSCVALCCPMTLDLDGDTAVADGARAFGYANPLAGKSVDDLRRDVPLFIARAGRDETPGLNRALDRFVTHALTRNLPLTLENHPAGPHAFDLFDPSAASCEVVRRLLTFLRFHLIESAADATNAGRHRDPAGDRRYSDRKAQGSGLKEGYRLPATGYRELRAQDS